MGGVPQLVDVCGNDRLSETWPPAARLKLVGRRKERLARDDVHIYARLRVIVVFPSERGFGARLLSDTALLRRQSIDRLLRLSILHNEHPILCLRAERVAVSSQGTCFVFRHRSVGRSFPIRCEYSFHSGGGTAVTVLTAIRTSRRVARSSVSRPEWSIPRPSLSPIPAPKRGLR